MIKPLLLQIISFYMKLLTLKHIEKCNKKDAFMTTYFYQRWESFLQNHRCELRKVKKTENPCNELKVQLISFILFDIIHSALILVGTSKIAE